MSGPLDVLIADGVIDEVLGRLKSGKEADISLVRRGEAILAAKVYKDRATRSFKNNADYKEGRKVRNSRSQRAMESGSKFGRDASEQAWKSAEADALGKLANAGGVRVPAPVMFYEGVLLMDVVVDAEGRPAPRLIDVAIAADAALGIYADLCAQMIGMLCCDLIHGDLSPYNILAAAAGPTIIDFPQVVSAAHSSRAEFFFLRDFDNVVRFMAGFDPALGVHTADGRAIWRAYVGRELTPQFVPPPPPPPRATRGPDRRGGPPQPSRPPQGRGPGANRPPLFSKQGGARVEPRAAVAEPALPSHLGDDAYRADPPRPPAPPPRPKPPAPQPPPPARTPSPQGRGPQPQPQGPRGSQPPRGPHPSSRPGQPPSWQRGADARPRSNPAPPPATTWQRGSDAPPLPASAAPARPRSPARAPAPWTPRPAGGGGGGGGGDGAKRGGKRRPKRHW